jgi:tetratricopeptide (TPR) repeat protein
MIDPASPVSESPTEQELRRIEGLLRSNQHAAALSAAEALLAQEPDDRMALYLLAVSQRLLQHVPQALETLDRLGRLHPGFTRLHQERGYCHVAERQAGPAIAAFLRAVNLNPALPASWNMLSQLYRMTGDKDNEAMASAHVRHLASLPTEIVTATALFSDGELQQAETLVREYLLKHGDHVEAMRLLARIGIELDVADDAELLLNAVLARAPDYHAARHDLARCLIKRHKHARAIEELERLLAVEPGNSSYRTTYAGALVGLGDASRAMEIYQALALADPQSAELHLSIGHIQKTLGRQSEAIAAYRTAAAAQPNFGDAYWSLANLKTYRFKDDELALMQAGEADAGTSLVDRYHLSFALGKAFEDRGDYAKSFHYYERGNGLKKAETRYRPEPIERNARLQREVCTREFFEARGGFGAKSNAPIFIVGLPRSGSTLLEQILASHSQVEGTMELADIPRLVHELQDREISAATPRYPGILASMTAADFERLGEKYLADTAAYRTGKSRFIDKMPNNFRHVGLIHLMLPNATIIDARREPMACCFGNLKQLFAFGQEFTYSIDDIARYYRAYVELMDHWDGVLPRRILRVQYEDVVADLESSVHRILEFCGLQFEPACLEFYKTSRSVRTASSEQVRKPINREGLDQWRNFQSFLAPLREALGPLAGP